MRQMNIFRDMSQVADLIELCFSDTMDHEGRRTLSDMRRAGREAGQSPLGTRLTETASVPLTGFVWEENQRIVGNASLIPYRDRGKRVYFVANIAVHPDYRRRGIARILTSRVMQHGWEKKASALWLQVRDDNPGAIHLYDELGFEEVARRTHWKAKTDPHLDEIESDIRIMPRHTRHWYKQQSWLRRLHPDVLNWYHPLDINALRPGLMNWLYLLFVDMHVRQWAALRGETLLATLAWIPNGNRPESLIPAAPLPPLSNEGSSDAMTKLLIHARRVLTRTSSVLFEYPAAEMEDAFTAAGFSKLRTLLWMRILPATRMR